ncbi:MAG: galactokinase [Lachnospiraceae bacterium]|nr:galactokinase [Lachnospiraceae bacterium]
MKREDWEAFFSTDSFNKTAQTLYGPEKDKAQERYTALLQLFDDTFGEGGDIALFSAPGRTEIGGNHTDHQHGRVLAASVNMDSIAAVRVTGDGWIRIKSEGYPKCEISLDSCEPAEEEKNTTASLIRGVAAAFIQRGCVISGFEAAVTSSVLPGSGISSSAAFEVLVGHIINHLFYEKKASAVEIAQIGQYAENVFFGKPSGLMDQTASSVGNLLTIDFNDPKNPIVHKLDVDFAACGLALCIIDSGADHADLTDEYAAIPIELKKLCACFGKDVLRDIPEEDFMEKIPELRKAAGDRAVLRAFHFYADNARVPEQAKALESGNTDEFLRLVNESGRSSWMYLQNIVPCGSKEHQEMAVTLAVCEKLLGGRGACRVHGGGFAGTVQAFVPVDMLDDFRSSVEKTLGSGCCHVLAIRPEGGVRIGE